MSYRSDMDAKIRRIEQDAADALWNHRDDLVVDCVLAAHEGAEWGRRFVRYGDSVYHPVVSITDDFSSATALLETPEGAITLQAGSGPLADAWDATLSWRILKLLVGKAPEIREWVIVPRPGQGMLQRLVRRISPMMKLTDTYDIVRNDLAMHVLTTILENDLRPGMPEFTYHLEHCVEMHVRGNQMPRYTIMHPQDGGVSIPARLRQVYGDILSPREKRLAHASASTGTR